VSLEGRVPFLDHKFVELAMGIPAEMKTKNGELKHILKRAVRGVIPDEIIDRKKQGFGVPVYEWFFSGLGERTKKELDEFCHQTDLLDRRGVARLIEQKQGPQLWYLLNLALWWKHFIAGEPVQESDTERRSTRKDTSREDHVPAVRRVAPELS
jgi:asparagine synthase (glutamine-hydrolysing)